MVGLIVFVGGGKLGGSGEEVFPGRLLSCRPCYGASDISRCCTQLSSGVLSILSSCTSSLYPLSRRHRFATIVITVCFRSIISNAGV